MQAAWRAGVRRVRLFCAEELRPAACCIVDALHARGYEVTLATGNDARGLLQQPASADMLRVVWAPEGTDRDARSRLRDALDPDAAGDVMVLAAATPRGVIDAIDAFGTPRKRRRVAGPRREFLVQPTLVERKLDARGWSGSVLGGLAITCALFGGAWWSGRVAATTEAAMTRPHDEPATPTARPTHLDEPVLAGTRAPSFDDDAVAAPEDEDDDDGIVLLDDEPTVHSVSDAAQPLEPAPLESVTAPVAPPPIAAALAMPSGGMPMPAMASDAAQAPRAIDPFR